MELSPGTVIEDLYEIVRPIGKGATAWVYAARQRGGADEVAVKVLTPDRERPDALRRRFLRELVLATRVRHPNLVAIHDFGSMEGTDAPYLVMELLRGRSLHQVLREDGPLAEDRAVRLFLGVLSALAEAHALGVVHKDLKPSNLFLRTNEDGTEDLVVLDFGIAHRVTSAEEGDCATVTPRYAAPEYILRYEVAPCLDVYQAGLVLAEAIAGHPVVTAPTAIACFRMHASGRLDLPRSVCRSRLAPTLRRALHPDSAVRYADAGEFLVALRAAAGIAPPALPDVTAPSAPRPTVQVNRADDPGPRPAAPEPPTPWFAEDPDEEPGSIEPSVSSHDAPVRPVRLALARPAAALAGRTIRAAVLGLAVAAVVAMGLGCAGALAVGWLLERL